MFSPKTVNDLTESIIHSRRRLIHVRKFTLKSCLHITRSD